MPSGANKLQIFNKLKLEVQRNLHYKEIFNRFKIKSYDFNEPLVGGLEFVIDGDQEKRIFVMTSKKLNDIQIVWTGNI